MKSTTPNHNHKYRIKTNALLNKNKRLKKIISIINHLNKKFEENYNLTIHKVYFINERLKFLSIHHQKDILNILNSFLVKEEYKPTVIRTLREDLRFLIKLKALEKRILTFKNNIGQFKGKLCIYQTNVNSYNLINTYFSSTKVDLIKKIKQEKDSLKQKNVTENVTVYNNPLINIYNKNSIFHQIKNITSATKNPEKTYKNSILNYKDFYSYLKHDYEKSDINRFYLKTLKKYKHKIHFMQKNAPYKTDFFTLAGIFKDTYTSKWKLNKNISNNYLNSYKRKKI